MKCSSKQTIDTTCYRILKTTAGVVTLSINFLYFLFLGGEGGGGRQILKIDVTFGGSLLSEFYGS